MTTRQKKPTIAGLQREVKDLLSQISTQAQDARILSAEVRSEREARKTAERDLAHQVNETRALQHQLAFYRGYVARTRDLDASENRSMPSVFQGEDSRAGYDTGGDLMRSGA